MNLAISDSIGSFYLLGLGIADYVMLGVYAIFEQKKKWKILCMGFGFLQNFTMETSLINLVQMSGIYVWIITSHKTIPFRYIIGLSFSMYMLSALFSLVPLFVKERTYSTLCIYHTFIRKEQVMLIYSMILHLVVNGSLLFGSIILTIKAISTIRSSSQRIQGHVIGRVNKSKAIAILVLMTCCRCLCWTPLHLTLLVLLSGRDITPVIASYLMLMGFSLNIMINPFLYTIRAIRKQHN